jgi:hypothetical protein
MFFVKTILLLMNVQMLWNNVGKLQKPVEMEKSTTFSLKHTHFKEKCF